MAEIAKYIAETTRSPELARKMHRALIRQCERMARVKSKLGRARPDLREGLRSVPLRPYITFFSYVGDSIEIVRILHGARDLPPIFKDDA